MRHQSTFIFASILLMLTAACSRDLDGDCILSTAPESDDTEQGYAVSIEQALTNLENELSMIDSGDETRSAQPRRLIKSVRKVAYDDVAPATRSADIPDDVADLFYIVEFAGGEGSAVLGADTRVEPVFAILDETVLTPEDFADADIESDDITSYVSAVITKGAALQLASLPSINLGGDTIRQPIDKFWGPGRDTVFCKQAPLLKTKWNQSSPYNNMCYNSNNQKCPAGCGPIAIAQILKNNRYPQTITINGNIFSWTLLDECDYGSVPSYYARNEVARFVYQIGQYTHITYNPNGSGIDKKNVPPLFNHVGYQSVSLKSFSLFAARDMICNQRLVFYMRGQNSGSDSGHAWVIDGWNEYTVRYWNCYYDTHGGIDMEILDRVLLESRTYTKMHCNFGWGGLCDGYYSENLFDTTKRLSNGDIDTSVGDYGGIADSDEKKYLYNSNFNMITYSIPRIY